MNSLWVDVEAQTYPQLDTDLLVDVAIIGGGLAGVGAAWALRESGASVTLLEMRTIASGASGRNAGFLVAGPAMGFRSAIERAGLDAVLEIWDLTDQNQQIFVSLIDEHRIDCGFLRRGSLSLAADEDEWDDLLLNLKAMTEAGISACSVKRESLPLPFDRMYLGGVYVAGNAEIDPARFVRGVASTLSSTQIYERTPVRSLQRNSHWILDTPAGRVVAGSVIVATNAYTDVLLPRVPIVATRGQVLATAPLSSVVIPFPMGANHGYQYWRQTPDGRLVVGGWRNLAVEQEASSEEELSVQIQQALAAFTGRLTPHQPVLRWAGIMGFTPDRFPLVGAVPDRPGLFITAGFSGHGVSMAFTCGARVAERATGRQCSIPASFDPARFMM